MKNRYSQSTRYLICSCHMITLQGLFQPRCKLKPLKNRRAPEEQVGFVSRRENKVLKITLLCFCQVEDNEERLNHSFKGNQNQALAEDLSYARYLNTESIQGKMCPGLTQPALITSHCLHTDWRESNLQKNPPC